MFVCTNHTSPDRATSNHLLPSNIESSDNVDTPSVDNNYRGANIHNHVADHYQKRAASADARDEVNWRSAC